MCNYINHYINLFVWIYTSLYAGIVPRTLWISLGGAIFLGIYDRVRLSMEHLTSSPVTWLAFTVTIGNFFLSWPPVSWEFFFIARLFAFVLVKYTYLILVFFQPVEQVTVTRKVMVLHPGVNDLNFSCWHTVKQEQHKWKLAWLCLSSNTGQEGGYNGTIDNAIVFRQNSSRLALCDDDLRTSVSSVRPSQSEAFVYLENIWPGITKFYKEIHTDLLYIHTR